MGVNLFDLVLWSLFWCLWYKWFLSAFISSDFVVWSNEDVYDDDVDDDVDVVYDDVHADADVLPFTDVYGTLVLFIHLESSFRLATATVDFTCPTLLLFLMSMSLLPR